MIKRESVLGIDLGSSSVKMILRDREETLGKVKENYEEDTPAGWWKAVRSALSELDLQGLAAIGLSSQVGTYLIDGNHVIKWSDKEGKKELAEIKDRCGKELFLKEISMPHPNIISYPIPRLMYIKRYYPDAEKVCQPKDFLCEMLTGNRVSDKYSWRGLANISGGQYSRKMLDMIDFPAGKLPRLTDSFQIAGYTKQIEGCIKGTASEEDLLPAGIPVFTGMNDFFASILGLGVCRVGEMFDISGTSEHLGVIEDKVSVDTELISGPYLKGNVHYGVTASAGSSLEYGLRVFGFENVNPERSLARKAPVFLPYLNGERAPVWDVNARGMFFGIRGGCDKADMAYAVLEGVLFSLYHIYECMGMPRAELMRTSGGAAVNRTLNEMKAELFGVPVAVPEETDTSALGACMTAVLGLGWFADIEEAAEKVCAGKEMIKPCGRYRERLKQRFAVYKDLYPATKKLSEDIRRI